MWFGVTDDERLAIKRNTPFAYALINVAFLLLVSGFGVLFIGGAMALKEGFSSPKGTRLFSLVAIGFGMMVLGWLCQFLGWKLAQRRQS
jgi:uncharacterized membrane protein YGL010W